MEGLANYIADHQYNEALKDGDSKTIDYSKIITQSIPTPPYYLHILSDNTFYEDITLIEIPQNIELKPIKMSLKVRVIYENTLQELRILVKNEFNKEKMIFSTLGRYFLGQCIIKNHKEQERQMNKGGIPSNYSSFKKAITPPEIEKVLSSLDHFQTFHSKNHVDLNDYKQLYELLLPLKVARFSNQLQLLNDIAVDVPQEDLEEYLDEFLEKLLDEETTKEGKLGIVANELYKEMTNVLSRGFVDFCKTEKYWITYLCLIWYLKVRPPSKKDFILFRNLGRGAFGVVSGARNVFTGKMVALKAMNRKVIKYRKCEDVVLAEKTILAMLGDRPSPFAVQLFSCFNDAQDIFLTLPLLTGGDLSFHLGRIYDHFIGELQRDIHLDHNSFKIRLYDNLQGFAVELGVFYAAEIFAGLLHLHSLGIIYRDLKPENVLLSSQGHVQISDMGLSLTADPPPETNRRELYKGRAGTPGYWCPEMVQGRQYGYDCDWWSYGATIYELFYGLNPFNEKSTDLETRDEGTLKFNIKCRPIPFPGRDSIHESLGFDVVKGNGFEKHLQDLLDKLMCKEKIKRLGMHTNPKFEMMNHPFFASIDFEKLFVQAIEPPWLPPSVGTNAETETSIDARNLDFKYKKGKLTVDDHHWVNENVYVSAFAHEQEVIKVLRLKASNKLNYLDEKDLESKICAIA